MLVSIVSVLLVVLKILLWILLAVIGLVILVLALVLFVPIRYQVTGDIEQEIDIKIRITWLLHLLSIQFDKNKAETKTTAKLAFFKIYQTVNQQAPTESEVQSESALIEEPPPLPEPKEDNQPNDSISTKQRPKPKPMGQQLDGSDDLTASANAEHDNVKQSEQKRQPDSRPEQKNKPKAKPKSKSKGKAKTKSAGIEADQEEGSIAKAKRIIEFLQRSENKGVLKFIWKYVKKVIRWLLPKRIRADMEVGLTDPAMTGYLVGVGSLLYVWTDTKVRIAGNFHQKMLRGSFWVKGNLFLFLLIYYALRVIIDRRVRRLFKQIRR